MSENKLRGKKELAKEGNRTIRIIDVFAIKWIICKGRNGMLRGQI